MMCLLWIIQTNYNTIENLLTEHLVIGKDLIVALKNNNQSLAKVLNDKWYKNADSMADFFSRIIPFIKEKKLGKCFIGIYN